MTMLGHEAIIRLLAAADVRTVFQYMAEDTMHMMSDLETEWGDTFDVIHARHEQGAVIMADGYSRSNDRIGVCVVGRGPGVAQTGTGLINARKHGSRLLVIVPEPALRETYDKKTFEQDAFLRSTVEEVVRIRDPEPLIPRFREALRRIHLGDGPIAVQIPWDVLDNPMDIPETDLDRFTPSILEATTGTDRVSGSTARFAPPSAQVTTAVEAYLDSDAFTPPVILAGRGAIASDAKEAIESLAERINAVLATTLEARGYFEGHPFHVGFTGNWGSPLANEFLTEANYVIGVGCSLNYHTVDHGYLIDDDATVVHIDTQPVSIGRYTGVDIAMLGDARTAITALDEAFEDGGIDREDELWTERLRERIAEYSPLDGHEFPEQDGTIDPREAIRKFDVILPAERLVGTDGGHFRKWVLDGITAESHNSIIACDFSAVGVGLPLSVGAAQSITQPPSGTDNRTSVVFCGDAGFMMSLQELETAARYDLPLVAIVLNDSSLGAEYHAMDANRYTPEVADIPTPEFAHVAESLGAKGHTARSLDDIDALADRLADQPDGPIVIDCKVNPAVRHRTY